MDPTKLRDLLDEAQHGTDTAKHCVVEIAPDEYVVTRTRAQAVRLRALLAELRQPAPAEPEAPVEASTPRPPAKRAARAVRADQ